MKDFELISDAELRDLLRTKVLRSKEGDSLGDELADIHAKMVFTAPVMAGPAAAKEAQLLGKVKLPSATFKAMWLLSALAMVTCISIAAFISGEKSNRHFVEENIAQKFSRRTISAIVQSCTVNPQIYTPACSCHNNFIADRGSELPGKRTRFKGYYFRQSDRGKNL